MTNETKGMLLLGVFILILVLYYATDIFERILGGIFGKAADAILDIVDTGKKANQARTNINTINTGNATTLAAIYGDSIDDKGPNISNEPAKIVNSTMGPEVVPLTQAEPKASPEADDYPFNYCDMCGSPLNKGDRYCGNCGKRIL